MSQFTQEQLEHFREPPQRIELSQLLSYVLLLEAHMTQFMVAPDDVNRAKALAGLEETRRRMQAMQRRLSNCGVDPEAQG